VVQSTRTLASDLLAAVGYQAGHVRSDVPAMVGGRVMHADFVGFGRLNGPFDASTATIVVDLIDDLNDLTPRERHELGQVATALSAPAVIVADLHHWTLFAVEADGDVNAVRELSWSADPGELRQILNPRTLLEAKLGHRQLALFPAAATVSTRGRSMRHQSLAPRVGHALSSAADVMLKAGIAETAKAAHARAARAVMGALTIVVLRDKDATRAERWASRATNSRMSLARYSTSSPNDWSTDILVNQAIVAHPQQFGWLIAESPTERDLLKALVDQFTDTDFSTVEPMLLSELYEKRIVDDSLRRSLGTHYTPPGLARRILAWLPIEEIEPEKRSVFDPTCGSGAFLVAAHDRLRDLQLESLTPDRSHAELVTMIRGADKDPVAVAIADLALFLTALPAGNGWQIAQRDFFSSAPLDPPPSVVVANPPWEYGNQDKQDDQAQRILARLIAQVPPEGLLGVILPSGWLTRRSLAARDSRAQLFNALDVFEIWRLPSGTFPNADMGAAVVLARRGRRLSAVRYPTVHRRISTPEKLEEFFDRGNNQSVLSWQTGPEELGKGPLRSWWEKRIGGAYKISDYATAVIGPQPESPGKLAVRRSHQAPNTAIVRWDLVAAFSEVHEAPSTPLRFPDDMQGGSRRGGAMVDRPKVLVSGVKNPERPWRLKVAIDEIGDLIVRNTVTAILPLRDRNSLPDMNSLSESDMLYGLFAFLGSGFVSAWLDEGKTTRYVNTADVLEIPAPAPRILRRLARLGKRLLSTEEKTSAIHDLEQEVWKWLDIPENVRALIIDRLNEAVAPERRLRYPQTSLDIDGRTQRFNPESQRHVGLTRPRAGVILSVEGQTVTLAVPGLTPREGKTIPVPPRMPGALLTPGNSMIVLDDGGPMQDMVYLFDEVAYLSDEQLTAEFVALAER